ncbi:helix-turn-helix transcriptional regulator [Rhizobium leguminosarum]|nr:helix-turn-helix transcriptional regulator [Rhizobium leguminosarum]NKM08402.1 helix-turn-helix domain-containing protein [Rhizobium leguminosarum bv. viciae]
MVVMPEDEYRNLIETAEDASDIADANRINERIAKGEEELIPSEFVNRIIDGECKVTVWREYRAMSASELAENAGISAECLLQIENGERGVSFEAVKKIATALNISVDDLA